MSLENTHDIGNVKIVMLAGGGGGAVALSDLTDVNILNPSNGQVLGFNSTSGKWENMAGGGSGTSYAGLGIGKKKTVTSGVIDTDIDLHRAPIVGDRLLIYFDEKVTNPTGLTTYNNGTAVTSNVESVTPLNFGNGWNIFEFKNDGLLYDNCWVRMQNVPIPNNTLSGLSDTAIVSPSDGQLLTYDNESQKWKNKTYVEANTGSPATELKKLKVGNVVYDTDGLKNYSVTNVANNNITVSVLNPEQFVQEVIAINTGNHTGSSSAWNLVLSGGMIPVSVALTKADGTAFDDDITANELLFIYVDTAGNVARVLDIPVNTTEIKTVSGNPITLTDAIAGNAIEVSAEIVASQDLHGYDKPWVGGAGKNKYFGSPSFDGYTGASGWTLETEKYNGNNVYSRTSNWGGAYYPLSLTAGNYVFSFAAKSTASVTVNIFFMMSGSPTVTTPASATAIIGTSWQRYNIPFTLNEDATLGIRIEKSTTSETLYLSEYMLETGTSMSNYEPYTNICPITGFSSVTITDVDAESHTATVTVALGQTVYGGTLDLTSGELTVTHAIDTLTSADQLSGSAPQTSANGNWMGMNLTASPVHEVANISLMCSNCKAISFNDRLTADSTDRAYINDVNDIAVLRLKKDTAITTKADFFAHFENAQIVYELATPTTTTLTAAQLALVKGYNQLTCNSGDMEITYKASGLDALKERVDELEDRVDDLTVSDLADTAITTPTNGQVLTFDSVTGKWENQNPSGGEVYFDQTATLSTSTTTTITYTESEITTSSVIDIAVSEWGLTPEDVTVTTGVCTVVMPKVSTARSITVRIYVR